MTIPTPLQPDSASGSGLRVRQDPQRSDIVWEAGGLLLALSITVNGGTVSFAIIAVALARLPFVVGYELRADTSCVSTALRILGVRVFRRQFAASDIQRVFSGAAGLVIESNERRLAMPGTSRRAADWVAQWVVARLGALR